MAEPLQPRQPGHLQAPWRIDYIRSIDKAASSTGCFLCDAGAPDLTPEQRQQRLVLWSTEHMVVLLNRFPYANGHLLIAPRAHLADLSELSEAELVDLQVQTRKGVELLRRGMAPQGFNIGINLGRCAGAGVPGHLHQHLVPRWGGDVNYMSVIGEVKVLPEALSQTWAELSRLVESG